MSNAVAPLSRTGCATAIAFGIGFLAWGVFGLMAHWAATASPALDRVGLFFDMVFIGICSALVWLGIYFVSCGQIVRSRAACITIGALLPFVALGVTVIGVIFALLMLKYCYLIFPIGGLGGELIWRLYRRPVAAGPTA